MYIYPLRFEVLINVRLFMFVLDYGVVRWGPICHYNCGCVRANVFQIGQIVGNFVSLYFSQFIYLRRHRNSLCLTKSKRLTARLNIYLFELPIFKLILERKNTLDFNVQCLNQIKLDYRKKFKLFLSIVA